MNKLTIFAAAACLISSCYTYDIPGVIAATSPGVDVRFADSKKLNPSDDVRAVLQSDSEEYEVYLCADTHISDKTENLETMLGAFIADGTSPMILCLGDMSNAEGGNKLIMDHIAPVADRFFACAGNHDLYRGEWQKFLDNYGSSSYLLEVVTPSGKKDLFISLDSAGSDVGQDQYAWLRDYVFGVKAAKEKYRHITVYTHNCFFVPSVTHSLTGTVPLEECYALAKLFSDNSVSIVLTGHHHLEDGCEYKNVKYVILDALKEGESNAAYYIYRYGDSISSRRIGL